MSQLFVSVPLSVRTPTYFCPSVSVCFFLLARHVYVCLHPRTCEQKNTNSPPPPPHTHTPPTLSPPSSRPPCSPAPPPRPLHTHTHNFSSMQFICSRRFRTCIVNIIILTHAANSHSLTLLPAFFETARPRLHERAAKQTTFTVPRNTRMAATVVPHSNSLMV